MEGNKKEKKFVIQRNITSREGHRKDRGKIHFQLEMYFAEGLWHKKTASVEGKMNGASLLTLVYFYAKL